MKVFVTGADGMLGTNVIVELIRQKYQVTALIHPKSKSTTLNNLPIQKVFGDILDLESIQPAIKGHDFVIHVAAATAVWPSRNKKVLALNISGTKNVMLASKAAGVKRMVHVGSANSFSPGTKDNLGTEANAYDGWKYKNDYMDSKYLAQSLLLKAYKEEGFPVVVVAPTFMIGEYDSQPSSGRLILGYVEGAIPGYSRGVKNYIAASDVATAIVNALSKGRLGECYIAGAENLSYKEFFTKVGSATGMQRKLNYFPFPLIQTIGAVSSVAARITGKQPKLSMGIARLSAMEQFYSSEKAQAELNMPQTPIEKGIKNCLDWMQENNVKL